MPVEIFEKKRENYAKKVKWNRTRASSKEGTDYREYQGKYSIQDIFLLHLF